MVIKPHVFISAHRLHPLTRRTIWYFRPIKLLILCGCHLGFLTKSSSCGYFICCCLDGCKLTIPVVIGLWLFYSVDQFYQFHILSVSLLIELAVGPIQHVLHIDTTTVLVRCFQSKNYISCVEIFSYTMCFAYRFTPLHYTKERSGRLSCAHLWWG